MAIRYTWGYIKDVALAKLDLDISDDSVNDDFVTRLINRFPYYANEAMTQICSAIKPKATFAHFEIHNKYLTWAHLCKKYNLYNPNIIQDLPVPTVNSTENEVNFYNEWTNTLFANEIVTMPNDFIGFGDDQNYKVTYCHCDSHREEIHDTDFKYCGYNKLMFNEPGEYYISYNARWYFFDTTMQTDTDLTDIPSDIIDCIPSYIASQCYKVDDEVKSQIFRNEFEMAIARIDDTRYENVKTFTVGGDW